MKKALFAFAAATAMLAGCQLADDFSVNSNANKGGRTPLTVTATFEDCTTRSILVADGDNYRPTWQAGDQIYIKGYIESNEGRDIYSAGEGSIPVISESLGTISSIAFWQYGSLIR